jgi:hypothetical protein
MRKNSSSQAESNRNLVVVKEGVVADCYKGLPDETNNAIFYTYHQHAQEAPNFVSQAVTRITPLKVVRASRVILSLLSKTEHRAEIKDSLRSLNAARRLEVLGRIDFTKLDLSPDTLKTIAFQLGQTNALIEGHELYTKQEVQSYAPAVADLIARRSGALHALNELRDDLLEKVDGVYVRQKGALNLFMYGNALAIDSWSTYARQSRGMIIDMARERCVSFPMDKFFRFGEGPEITRESLSPDMAVEIVEKVDGSMVSLIDHDNKREFCCKGNFDTPQTQRAAEIAERLPIDRLQTDRYYHVFEVIYPENRFPSGLSIVDYGQREDLVLTSMRDRLTNRMLPYTEVVAEAQRVGLNHPRVFQGGLAEVFNEVDTAAPTLHEEGFIIRSQADGKLYKLKYDGYKEVLRMVNEMRTNRFVKEHLTLNTAERQKSLNLLPPDIRIVAEQQLGQHRDIMERLLEYCQQVQKLIPPGPQESAAFVLRTVPADLQKLIFQYHRRGPSSVSQMLEKAALDIYYGKVPFPEAPRDGIWYNEHKELQDSTNEQMIRNMAMQFDKSQKVSPKDIQLIFNAMHSDFGPSFDERREMLRARFGDAPIPRSIIDAAIAKISANEGEYKAMVICQLAEMRGKEMLPWIEPLLHAKHLYESAWAAIGLLYLSEARGLKEIERLFREHLGNDTPNFSFSWFCDELQNVGTPACLALSEKIYEEWNAASRAKKAK